MKATAPYRPKTKEHKPAPHMRAKEIDAHPRPVPMVGIGMQSRSLGGREAER